MIQYVNKLSLSEVKYWYYHQDDEKQIEIKTTLGLDDTELKKDNSGFEQMRMYYSNEILEWYEL